MLTGILVGFVALLIGLLIGKNGRVRPIEIKFCEPGTETEPSWQVYLAFIVTVTLIFLIGFATGDGCARSNRPVVAKIQQKPVCFPRAGDGVIGLYKMGQDPKQEQPISWHGNLNDLLAAASQLGCEIRLDPP